MCGAPGPAAPVVMGIVASAVACSVVTELDFVVEVVLEVDVVTVEVVLDVEEVDEVVDVVELVLVAELVLADCLDASGQSLAMFNVTYCG